MTVQMISIGERGMAVTFGKEDLLNIKAGGTVHGELVGPNGKTKIMFMRDRTFQEMQRQFEKQLAEATAKKAAARKVEGAVGESQALGQAIGNSAEEPPQNA